MFDMNLARSLQESAVILDFKKKILEYFKLYTQSPSHLALLLFTHYTPPSPICKYMPGLIRLALVWSRTPPHSQSSIEGYMLAQVCKHTHTSHTAG